jgi:predicted PurR-regulated permease PerM
MTRKVEVSHKTIIFTVVFLGSIFFLYYVRDIVLQLFVAMLLVFILNPLVSKLSKYRIPKTLSILFSYIIIFGFLGVAIGSILPPLIEQTTNLANGLPGYFQSSELSKYVNEDITKQLVSQLGSLPGQVVKAGFSLFSNILSILTIAIFAFYLLLIRDKFDTNLEFLFGKEKTEGIAELVNTLEIRLGGWARGQFALMLLIGTVSYVGFIILGIPYALPLAMLAGIFEIVPYVGPIVASIPAIILGFSISPFLGFGAIALSVLIQQLENYIFVPKIMEKSTGVSPIVTLVSLAVGFRLAGIVGMIISVPIVILIQTLLQTKLLKD